MISGVTREIAGKSETFRMSTRAMMAIEDRFDKGLVAILQGIEGGRIVTDVVRIISECACDGAGIDMDRATEIVDAMGFARAVELLGEVSDVAFPEAQGKNVKRAAKSK